jgi:hypothetical protein
MAVGGKIDADLSEAQSFRIGGALQPDDRQHAIKGSGGSEQHERHHVFAARNPPVIQIHNHCPGPVPRTHVLLPASRSMWMGADGK